MANILAFKFDYFAISQYRALHFKEINIESTNGHDNTASLMRNERHMN